MPTVGLVVNPVAGLGGTVGLKGSDGSSIQEQALALGARPASGRRAASAMSALARRLSDVAVVAADGAMGAQWIDRDLLVDTLAVGGTEPTTGADTTNAARELAVRDVDLILFAGGDGTARDVMRGIGEAGPVLGIPSGVKVYSGVFATHPRSAGAAAAEWLRSTQRACRPAEVMDIDEASVRSGVVQAELHGRLLVPDVAGATQGAKASSHPESEREACHGMARELRDRIGPDEWWLLGPGTTCAAIAQALGLPKTLTGVDVFRGLEPVVQDANEREILGVAPQAARLVVSPVGGQGFLLGRGNQQLTARVLRHIGGRSRLQVVATSTKIAALSGRPLLVDTGDTALDESLAGPARVVCGWRDELVTVVAPAWADADA